jgi:osmotically-inducible protein OsmY
MVSKPGTFFGHEPEVEVDDRTKAALEAAVAEALATSGGVDASDVHVTAQGSAIVLSGLVATRGELERATVVAQAVSGVGSVANNIVVA